MIADADALRTHYRQPHQVVLDKVVPTVDEAAATFLAASPFFVLASSSDDGADASPRGGPPGFVRVLDGGRIAWADLAGNNRLDSFQNVLARPEVGLLFFVPGLEETLRVNGRAELSRAPDVLAAVAFDQVLPKVAAVVHVTECYVHCAKALRRARLWDPAARPEPGTAPSPSAIITEHLQLDVDPALVEADLEAGYRRTMWLEGGDGT